MTLPLPGMAALVSIEDPANSAPLLVASAPGSPPEELTRLARARRREIRAAVAANPATPAATLMSLAGEFPSEFLKNEALPLHLLERPGLFAENPASSLALCRYAGLPPWLLEHLAEVFRGHRVIEQALLDHPGIGGEQVGRCCSSLDPAVRMKAAQHPRVPGDVVKLLVYAGSTRDLKEIAPRRRNTIDEPTLRRVVGLGPWGAVLAASHPRAPAGLLEELASHENDSVRFMVAGNPRTPPATLEAIATTGDIRLLINVLRNRATTEAMVERLSRVHPPTRENLPFALNPPPALLADLCAHANPGVRARTAAHPRTPMARVEHLADDPSADVREEVARRPDLALPVLERLARDTVFKVRRAATMQLRERRIRKH